MPARAERVFARLCHRAATAGFAPNQRRHARGCPAAQQIVVESHAADRVADHLVIVRRDGVPTPDDAGLEAADVSKHEAGARCLGVEPTRGTPGVTHPAPFCLGNAAYRAAPARRGPRTTNRRGRYRRSRRRSARSRAPAANTRTAPTVPRVQRTATSAARRRSDTAAASRMRTPRANPEYYMPHADEALSNMRHTSGTARCSAPTSRSAFARNGRRLSMSSVAKPARSTRVDWRASARMPGKIRAAQPRVERPPLAAGAVRSPGPCGDQSPPDDARERRVIAQPDMLESMPTDTNTS